jgi:hypothetical protein
VRLAAAYHPEHARWHKVLSQLLAASPAALNGFASAEEATLDDHERLVLRSLCGSLG